MPSLCAATHQFEALATPISQQACWQNAERFAIKRFPQEMRTFVEARVAALHLPTDPDLDIVTPFPSKGLQPSSLNTA